MYRNRRWTVIPSQCDAYFLRMVQTFWEGDERPSGGTAKDRW